VPIAEHWFRSRHFFMVGRSEPVSTKLEGSFMSEGTVELEDVSVEAETDLALLCNIDDKKHWIPKSVVHEDSEVSSEGDTGTIVLQRWFAEKEGLV
jgi:hypothetical protein